MPIRIQRKRSKGWRSPEGAVYVGRGSKWGNPFAVGKGGTAEECVRKYADMLTPYRHRGPTSDLGSLYISMANIEDIERELRGKDLMCWCPLDKPCHADVLLRLANG
jgi:Domain of unknown function (DUF4326)